MGFKNPCLIIPDAVMLLWPYEPRVEDDLNSRKLLDRLRRCLHELPLETSNSVGELGRLLNVRIVQAPITHPREGWTWFTKEVQLVEVASWLPSDFQQVVAAHELCHVILGPSQERHNRKTEKVCDWGANEIIRRVGIRINVVTLVELQKNRLYGPLPRLVELAN